MSPDTFAELEAVLRRIRRSGKRLVVPTGFEPVSEP